MTTSSMASATDPSDQRKFGVSAERHAETIRDRLFQVAIWGWRVACVCMAIYFMVGATMTAFHAGPDEAIGIICLYLGLAVLLSGLVWTARYVLIGEKRGFGRTLKETAFANLPALFWFVPGVLFVGALGNALWHGASNEAVFYSDFATGAGGALGVLFLGIPGWFLVPKKHAHVGHMVGTGVAGIATLASLHFGAGS